MTENTELARNPNHEPTGQQSPIPFSVLFLGVGSATPTLGRHQTAQLVTYRNDLFLIDCGEATQYRLIEQHVRPGRLRYIFISHLHG
ncbi:MAG: MBL fold metallo-hydrolase, partial [Rudanella sp.]|nr:MBL fold metallo-hydrolase [Rudanella sp.]